MGRDKKKKELPFATPASTAYSRSLFPWIAILLLGIERSYAKIARRPRSACFAARFHDFPTAILARRRRNWFAFTQAFLAVERTSASGEERKNEIKEKRGERFTKREGQVMSHIPDFPVYLEAVTKRARGNRYAAQEAGIYILNCPLRTATYHAFVTFRDTRFELNDSCSRAISHAGQVSTDNAATASTSLGGPASFSIRRLIVLPRSAIHRRQREPEGFCFPTRGDNS